MGRWVHGRSVLKLLPAGFWPAANHPLHSTTLATTNLLSVHPPHPQRPQAQPAAPAPSTPTYIYLHKDKQTPRTSIYTHHGTSQNKNLPAQTHTRSQAHP